MTRRCRPRPWTPTAKSWSPMRRNTVSAASRGYTTICLRKTASKLSSAHGCDTSIRATLIEIERGKNAPAKPEERPLRKMLFAVAALCACAITVEASAQAVSIDRKQVSNAAARKMVDACLTFAEKNNILVGVAVVGLDGVLLDFHAMQGGGPTLSETAILKAKTAVHWQRATK